MSPPPGACCTPLQREPLDADEPKQLARTMKALADPTRLRLLSIVAASEGAEACVCDLIEPVGLSQPTVSHHLQASSPTAGFLDPQQARHLGVLQARARRARPAVAAARRDRVALTTMVE